MRIEEKTDQIITEISDLLVSADLVPVELEKDNLGGILNV